VEDFAVMMRDPSTRLWYVLGGMALMVLPMLVMAIWYHTNIHNSPGGRELMRRQNGSRLRTRGSLGMVPAQLTEAFSIGRDIAAGRYGQRARKMQNTVYWIVGAWVVAQGIYFGLLIWADEVNRPLLP